MFNSKGDILLPRLDNGRLVYHNKEPVPEDEIVFYEEESAAIIDSAVFELARFDPVNTLTFEKCKKCDNSISVVFRYIGTTYFICKNCGLKG